MQFEFTEELLLFIADSLYDSRFGTFLFENEKARSPHENLPSMFDHITSSVKSFQNPTYRKPQGAASLPLPLKSTLLRPPIWSRYILRWNPAVLQVYTVVKNQVDAIKLKPKRDASEVSLKLKYNFFFMTNEFETGFGFLRSISISENQMTSLPLHLFMLTELTKLTLDENKLALVRSVFVCPSLSATSIDPPL